MIRWPTTYSPHEPGESSPSAATRVQFAMQALYSRSWSLRLGRCHRSRLSLLPPARRHFLPAIVQPPILFRLLANSPREDIVVPLRQIFNAAEFHRIVNRIDDRIHAHLEIKRAARATTGRNKQR